MSYEKINFKNREVEKPLTFKKHVNDDGTITLEPKPGTIVEPGTPLLADHFNHMDDGIYRAHEKIDNLKLSDLDIDIELGVNHVSDIGENNVVRDFENGITISPITNRNQFPSISEFGISVTFINKLNGGYGQMVITSNGDTWTRRTNSLTSWGEWYSVKNEIDTVKQSGVKSNKRISDKLNSLKIEASDTDSISENITKFESIPNQGKLTKTITTQGGQQAISPGYYSGGAIKAQLANLVPENIKKGVNVGGVKGTFTPKFKIFRPEDLSVSMAYDGDVKTVQVDFPRQGIPIAVHVREVVLRDTSTGSINIFSDSLASTIKVTREKTWDGVLQADLTATFGPDYVKMTARNFEDGNYRYTRIKNITILYLED